MDDLTTPDAVRDHYGQPMQMVLTKEKTRLDRHFRAFIAASPFFVMATSDTSGSCDASPRGDAPGGVAVVDDSTLLIPDRTGNNRVDTMMNIGANPHVGLLFLVPGRRETLRVNGKASITTDRAVLELLSAQGKLPCAAIRVQIEEVYFQCGKAIVRSDLWNPARQVATHELRAFGEVIAEQCGLEGDIQPSVEEAYRNDLY